MLDTIADSLSDVAKNLMCAIAGLLGTEGAETANLRVRSMVAVMRHRGPDRQSIAVVHEQPRRVVLGQARLSILDLSASANQPMHHAATRSCLVYNGEIFNFKTLRSELEGLGHKFESSGDTEVVLAALVEWGPSALAKFRGMYAIAFWDGRTRRLLLARDTFGIKPLLYARTKDGVVFASELRGVLASGLVDATPNTKAIAAYLSMGFVLEPDTAVVDVVSVPAGHLVTFDENGRTSSSQAILDLEQLMAATRISPRKDSRDAVDVIERSLRDSVSEQLVSDVPLGVFLSGGIDSSIVAGLAAQQSRDITYLTVTFPEPEFSEQARAQAIAATLAGQHVAVPLTNEDLLAMVPAAMDAMDQPTVDGINTYVVSRVAAARGIKVVLSGLGGDELFAGYTTFWKAPLLARCARVIPRIERVIPDRLLDPIQRAKLRAAGQGQGLRDAYLLQRALRSDVDIRTLDDYATSQLSGVSSYRNVSLLECSIYMRNQLLRDSDIFSSACSIELRVPFLSPMVARAAWSLPGHLHANIRSGGKGLLRSLMHRLYPTLPRSRRKLGFVLPWNTWLRNPSFTSMLADQLHCEQAYERLPIAPAAGKDLLDRFRRSDPTVSWGQVWSLFALLSWATRLKRYQVHA